MQTKPTISFNPSQQRVIDCRNRNTLVSASAGAGKTTVMIERLFQLLKNGDADLSQVVVVTFTKLAANQMKEKLAKKLSKEKHNPNVYQHLEKLDGCCISTIHSFCSNLLRNYFYVVDVDPHYAILEKSTLVALQQDCLKSVLNNYYKTNDEVFENLYKIFATQRNDKDFIKLLLNLYDKSRCQVDFYGWYHQVKDGFINLESSPLADMLNAELTEFAMQYRNKWLNLASLGATYGANFYIDVCQKNADLFMLGASNTLRDNWRLMAFASKNVATKPSKTNKCWNCVSEAEAEHLRYAFDTVREPCVKWFEKWKKQGFWDEDFDTLLKENQSMVVYADKVVEILQEFDKKFTLAKKQRGGVDFADLEHFAVQILSNQDCRAEITSQYKYVFVDEYQDTNDVQDAIVNLLSQGSTVFMVGDVKQSIYGFRGCDLQNFVNKSFSYQSSSEAEYVTLNDNYRSDKQILNFVNVIMNYAITLDFGKIDYKNTARLVGPREAVDKLPPVFIDVVKSEKLADETNVQTVYDVTNADDVIYDKAKMEGLAIAKRIQQFVGTKYVDQDTGEEKQWQYKDIAILSRAKKDYALAIYNVLLEKNIPVAGSFNMAGLKNKEIRTLVNLLRIIDNPYCDVAFVATCLSPLCNLTEQQLAQVKIQTESPSSFYDRATLYASRFDDEISVKLDKLLRSIERYRLFSYGSTVDQLLLEIVAETNFHLYVSGLPNATIRVKKLYEFIDTVKDQHYSQSVDKFLQYIDDATFEMPDDDGSQVSAVKFITMHASKGLEFPIVFVIGSQQEFNEDADALVYNAGVGLALDYHDFTTRTKRLSLGSYVVKQINKINSKEEEARLLYVALTRAQNHLVIPLHQDNVNKLISAECIPQKADSRANWIVPSLFNYLGSFDDGNYKDGVLVSHVDPLSEWKVEDNLDLLCKQSTNLDGALQQLAYQYPHAHLVVPSKITSSTLDAKQLALTEGEDEPAYVLPLANAEERIQLGVAYHKVYETINFDADRAQIERHVDALVQNKLVQKQIADSLNLDLIEKTLANPLLKSIVSSGKVYHEVPFLVEADYARFTGGAQVPTVLQGIIDLLVIDGDHATVVDFKYTSNSNGLETRYAKQLESYCYAVEKILKVKSLDCYILSIADNKLVKIRY